MIPALSFVGRHDAGKTTLLTKLIKLFATSDYKVGVVKHAHKEIEIPLAKDSEKLFLAGANQVYVSSPEITINYRRNLVEESLDEIYAKMLADKMDLILVEGFKEESLPKIEVIRKAINPNPILASNTIALVTDMAFETKLPVFQFAQTKQLLDFIIDYFQLSSSHQN